MSDDTFVRKRRGRPKGSPKVVGSGRQRGTPNKKTVATREQILELCDPLKLLANIALGKEWLVADGKDHGRRVKAFPNGDQRYNACQTLAHKLLPNLRAQELSGPLGGPIQTMDVATAGDAREELMKKLNGMSARMEPDEMVVSDKAAPPEDSDT